MKATIEFTLPEEEALFMTASNAHRYRAAVAAVYEWARRRRKYGDASAELLESVEELVRMLNEETEGLDT